MRSLVAPGTCQPTTVLVIHLATLPVQTSLAGGSPCLAILAIQKWFWDFYFFFCGNFGTCSSFGFVHASVIYIIMYFCANTWSCTQKNLRTSYVLTIHIILLKVNTNSGNANFSRECTNFIKLFSSKDFQLHKRQGYGRKKLRLWQPLCEKEVWDPPSLSINNMRAYIWAYENIIVKN